MVTYSRADRTLISFGLKQRDKGATTLCSVALPPWVSQKGIEDNKAQAQASWKDGFTFPISVDLDEINFCDSKAYFVAEEISKFSTKVADFSLFHPQS